MAFTLDTTYTLYIENPNEKGTTLRVGNAGYTVTREGEEGNYSFSIALTSTGEVLYSGVKKIGLNQSEGTIKGMVNWECRKVEVLETGSVNKIEAGTSSQSNECIEEFIDKGGLSGKAFGAYCLSNMRSLNKVLIGNHATEIGWGSFSCCDNLHRIVIPKNIGKIDGKAFNATPIEELIIEEGSSVLSMYLADDISYPPINPFQTKEGGVHDSLRDVYIGRDYEMINSGRPTYYVTKTFGYTDASIPITTPLRRVSFNCKTIPRSTCIRSNIRFLNIASVETIENYAFQECYSLTEVVLPKTVASIASYAFHKCTCEITCTSAQAEMITASGGFEGTFNIVDD